MHGDRGKVVAPRILLPGGDDPRNGIALTPDMHWAIDSTPIR